MKELVEAYKIYCDGCGTQYEYEEFRVFTQDWEWNESDWLFAGILALCETCLWKFEQMIETLVDGDESWGWDGEDYEVDEVDEEDDD